MNVQVAKLHAQSKGTGPGLVLLHPVGLDHTFWGPLVDAAARSYRVLCVDLRGHGRSPPARKGLGISDYAADVHDTIVRHRVGPAVVLGLSFGGMIAQQLALDYAEDVSALVLCGCPSGFSPEVRPVVRERGLAAERDGMESVVVPTIERWFTAGFRTNMAAERVRDRLVRDDPANWSAAWNAISTFDALPRLGEIRFPALVVAGGRDAALPIAAAETLAKEIPGAKLAVLSDAPHMMQIECADAFTAKVRDFLLQIKPAATANN